MKFAQYQKIGRTQYHFILEVLDMVRLNQSTPVERKINVAARRRELQNVPFAETGLAVPSVMLALQAEDMFLFFDAAPDLIGAADGPPLRRLGVPRLGERRCDDWF